MKNHTITSESKRAALRSAETAAHAKIDSLVERFITKPPLSSLPRTAMCFSTAASLADMSLFVAFYTVSFLFSIRYSRNRWAIHRLSNWHHAKLD